MNKVPTLGYDASTCALAKERVTEVNEKGIDVFGQSASFQRAVDYILDDGSLDREKAPDWYQEFLTYQETPEDAITEWSKYAGKVLFTEKKYEVGCVAEKDGFAIVVVGFWEKSPVEEKTYFQTHTDPNELEQISGSL